jgi:drug/metabolite transporter (DMT)-like permease
MGVENFACSGRQTASGQSVGSLLVAITVITWAVAFPAIRVGLRSFGAPELALARLLIASVALAFMAVLVPVPRPPRHLWGRTALCGLLGQALYQLLNMLGETRVPAGTASILIATAPLFSVLAASRLLGESARGRWPGILVALAGAALVALSARVGGGAFALAILGAALCQGLYHVIVKPLSEAIGAFASAAWSLWLATILVLPALPFLLGQLPSASTASLWSIVLLGVVPSAIGYAAWSAALTRADIAQTTSALYLVPVVALGVSWLWLGERPAVLAVVGGAMAITGVIIVRHGKGTRPTNADNSAHSSVPTPRPTEAVARLVLRPQVPPVEPAAQPITAANPGPVPTDARPRTADRTPR